MITIILIITVHFFKKSLKMKVMMQHNKLKYAQHLEKNK